MRLVEVVGAPATSESTIARLDSLMQRWGRTPVRSADAPGFIVNRVNRAFTLEPLAALEADEATVEAIDLATQDRRLPDGAVRADGPHRSRREPGGQHRAARCGARGRRSPRGPVPAVGPPGAARGGRAPRPQDRLGLLSHRPDAAGRRPTRHGADAAAAVVERTEIAIIDEAYRALGDGVATAPDIDLALRLGASHPMGPFERASLMGGPAIVLDRLGSYAGRGPRFAPAPALLDLERR